MKKTGRILAFLLATLICMSLTACGGEKDEVKIGGEKYSVELTDLEEFREHKKQTRFAKIIDGTDFSKYSIDGEFVADNYEFIENKTPNSYYLFTMVYKGENIGIWCDSKCGLMFVSNKVDLTYPLKYAITTNDHKPNMIVLSNKYSREKIKVLTKMYEYGCLRYESLKLKSMMFDIFKLLNIAKI